MNTVGSPGHLGPCPQRPNVAWLPPPPHPPKKKITVDRSEYLTVLYYFFTDRYLCPFQYTICPMYYGETVTVVFGSLHVPCHSISSDLTHTPAVAPPPATAEVARHVTSCRSGRRDTDRARHATVSRPTSRRAGLDGATLTVRDTPQSVGQRHVVQAWTARH